MSDAPNQLPALDAAIHSRLARLRRALQLRIVVEGLAWLAITLTAATLASLVVDFGLYRLTRQHMTVSQRGLLLLLAAAAVAFIGFRKLVRPLFISLSEDDLAQVVERANPALADRLISALQFARAADVASRGESPALVARMIQQANEMVGPLPFGQLVQSRHAARRVGMAAGGAIVISLLFLLFAPTMKTWASRMMLLSSATYPKSTHLTVNTPAVLRVARGASLEVSVDAAGVLPAEVMFHSRFGSGEVHEAAPPAAGSASHFVKRYEVVSEPFEFRVTGNDDATPVIRVEVAEPAYLREINLAVTPPPYTNRPAQNLPGSQTQLTVAAGSEITITAVATKDLAEARAIIDDKPVANAQIVNVPDESGHLVPRGLRATFTATPPEGNRPALALRFALVDTDHFVGGQSAQYTLLLAYDKPPTLELQLAGVAGQVTPHALIPLLLRGSDDYGVNAIEIEWSALSNVDKRSRLPVIDFTPPRANPDAVAWALDLEKLAGPGGATTRPAVEVGDTLRLVGLARDTLPIPQGPNSGTSNPLSLRVVSEQDLLASIVDAQRSLREQFRQTISMQAEAQGRTAEAANRAAEPNGAADARRLAGESGDQQSQLIDRVSSLASRFEDLYRQLVNNRLSAEKEKLRLSKRIIEPLKDISGGAMHRVSAALGEAQKVQDVQSLKDELTRLAAAQKDILTRMDAVLGEMVKVENAQQVEQSLKVIIDSSERVRQMMTTVRRGAAATQPAPR